MPGNPVEGNACGMWVSLDHVTEESGSVQWARGSHKWNKRYDPVGDGRTKREGYGYVGQPTLEEMPDIAGNPDKYDIVRFETFPGDFIVSSLLSVMALRATRRIAGAGHSACDSRAKDRLMPYEPGCPSISDRKRS